MFRSQTRRLVGGLLSAIQGLKLKLRRASNTRLQYGRLFSSRSFLLANTLIFLGVGSAMTVEDREEKLRGLRELIKVARSLIRLECAVRRRFRKAVPTSTKG